MNIPTDYDVECFIEAYQGGASLDEIAMFYGFARTTVRKHLVDNEIPIRGRGHRIGVNRTFINGKCLEGHEQTEENTKYKKYVTKDGVTRRSELCRECYKQDNRDYYRRKRKEKANEQVSGS